MQREKAVQQREEQLALLERIAEAMERIAKVAEAGVEIWEKLGHEDLYVGVDPVRTESSGDIRSSGDDPRLLPEGDGRSQSVEGASLPD
jgi:hypothetical protein